jgi:hypothetical protein
VIVHGIVVSRQWKYRNASTLPLSLSPPVLPVLLPKMNVI